MAENDDKVHVHGGAGQGRSRAGHETAKKWGPENSYSRTEHLIFGDVACLFTDEPTYSWVVTRKTIGSPEVVVSQEALASQGRRAAVRWETEPSRRVAEISHHPT